MAVGMITGTPITDAFDKGDHIGALKATARLLARQLDSTRDARSLASLTDKFLKIETELMEIEKQSIRPEDKKKAEVTVLHGVQNKRAAMAAGTKDSNRAKVS